MTTFFHDTETSLQLKARSQHLIENLRSIIEQRNWSRGQLEAFQTNTLKMLLDHAFRNIPFYHEKYLSAGFRPDHFRSLADLERIPLLTKNELRSADPAALRAPQHAAPARLLASSGSTGIPVRLFRTEHSLWRFTAANAALYYDWCHGQPLENVLYFIDPAPDGIDFALADLLRSTVMADRIVSAFEPVDLQAALLEEYAPEFISSYPSTLGSLGIYLDRQNRRCESTRLLHSTSETMSHATRRLLAGVFPNARLVETYTSTEAGLVGYECPAGSGFHIAEDSLLVETVGTPSRIVVTDLINTATPVIRYDGLGDLCNRENRPCSCGSVHRRITHLEGRLVDSVTLPGGATLSPYAVTNELDKIEGIYCYQLTQYEIGRFGLRVVISMETPGLRKQIEEALARVLGREARVDIETVQDILPPPGAHKVPLVVSRLWRAP